jgi:hypothetical protein
VSQNAGYQGLPGDTRPVPPSPTARAAPTTVAATNGRGKRPIQFPHQLRVNLSKSMFAALKRVSRRRGVPESITARQAITDALFALDARYHEECVLEDAKLQEQE